MHSGLTLNSPRHGLPTSISLSDFLNTISCRYIFRACGRRWADAQLCSALLDVWLNSCKTLIFKVTPHVPQSVRLFSCMQRREKSIARFRTSSENAASHISTDISRSRRKSAQKPPDELYEAFKLAHPDVGPGTVILEPSTAPVHRTLSDPGVMSHSLLEHRYQLFSWGDHVLSSLARFPTCLAGSKRASQQLIDFALQLDNSRTMTTTKIIPIPLERSMIIGDSPPISWTRPPLRFPR